METVLDQYYTSPTVAALCMSRLQASIDISAYTCLEPSAGTGSFMHLMPPGSRAIDLDPKTAGIEQRDFLEFRTIHVIRETAAIGNPPFGKNSSLAVAFFNHAATMYHVIAFIVPRTFRKASVINRLDERFHLIDEIDLPRNSFIFEDETYDVPCVFQIWKRHRRTIRARSDLPLTHPDFTFVKKHQLLPDDGQALAIQRVGANAGAIKKRWLGCADASHYFMSVPDTVLNRLAEIDFDGVRHNTAGNPSISKRELVALYDATTPFRVTPPTSAALSVSA